MKKKRLSFELAEAQVESLKEQKEELQQELAQTVQLLSEAQKITMECAIETKQSTEEHSIVLRTLQDSVSTLSTQLGTTELSLRSTQDTLKHTQNLLESESQSRLDLERQLTMAKNDLNKLDECDRVVTELTQKLKNGSLPSGVQEKDAIALLESQTKALEFELHDLELDNARLQEKAQIESSALESAKKEKQNAETHIKELTLRLAEMVRFMLIR